MTPEEIAANIPDDPDFTRYQLVSVSDIDEILGYLYGTRWFSHGDRYEDLKFLENYLKLGPISFIIDKHRNNTAVYAKAPGASNWTDRADHEVNIGAVPKEVARLMVQADKVEPSKIEDYDEPEPNL